MQVVWVCAVSVRVWIAHAESITRLYYCVLSEETTELSVLVWLKKQKRSEEIKNKCKHLLVMNRFDSAQYRIQKMRRSDDGKSCVVMLKLPLFCWIVNGIITQTDRRDNHTDHRLFIIHSVCKPFKFTFERLQTRLCEANIQILSLQTLHLQFCILFATSNSIQI